MTTRSRWEQIVRNLMRPFPRSSRRTIADKIKLAKYLKDIMTERDNETRKTKRALSRYFKVKEREQSGTTIERVGVFYGTRDQRRRTRHARPRQSAAEYKIDNIPFVNTNDYLRF